MFIDKNSLQVSINNRDWLSLGNYITEATYSFNKLFAEGSGRNLAGTMVATLNGIYPKINCKFRKLNKDELVTISKILDSKVQYVKYFDPSKNKSITMKTYTGDYSVDCKRIGIVEGVDCSFIAIEKRK